MPITKQSQKAQKNVEGMMKPFLCYAREDESIALKLFSDLKNNGIRVWMNKSEILPGENWKQKITKAIKESTHFLALISDNSINKKGYVQKKLKLALEVLNEMPDSEIYIIPIRITDCIPNDEKLNDIQWVDLFVSYKKGLEKILKSLKIKHNSKFNRSIIYNVSLKHIYSFMIIFIFLSISIFFGIYVKTRSQSNGKNKFSSQQNENIEYSTYELNAEYESWQYVKQLKDVSDVEVFLSKYPDGMYATGAKLLLKNLSETVSRSNKDKNHSTIIKSKQKNKNPFDLRNAYVQQRALRPVRQFITSASSFELVSSSVFKVEFINALKGNGDLDSDSIITGTELAMYLHEKVVHYSGGQQHPQYGKIREPNLDKGDFIFKVQDKGDFFHDITFYNESYALIIGVSEYKNGWPRLPYVIDHTRDVKNILQKHKFQVTIASNPDSYELKHSLIKFINLYGNDEDNRLLIYYTGHGYSRKLAYGGYMGYIIPCDAPDPNINLDKFYMTALDMQLIEVLAKIIRSKHALFIFDSAFASSIFSQR